MKNLAKRINFLFIFGTILFLLSACSVTNPASSNDGDAIDNALRDGMDANRAPSIVADKGKSRHVLPIAIRKALMPDVKFYGSTASAAGLDDEQHFDIAASNVPAKEFFVGLVKGTKYNMTINPQVAGNISLELKGVTIPQAMDAVRDSYGFEYSKTSYGYQVSPRQLETKIFKVDYLDIARNGQSQTTVGSGQITNTIQNQNATQNANTNNSGVQQQVTNVPPSGVIQTSSNSDFWGLLKQNLVTIIGSQEGRSIVLNPESGSIIVRAYPDELRSVGQYLDNIQSTMQRQVIIEAKVLEVELKATYQSGINWKLLGLQQGTTDATMNFGQDVQPFNGIMNINATYGNAFSSVIKLLNTQGEVNVLSSPRVATINNQKAVIKVGSDRFFVTNVSSNTNNNTIGSSNTTASVTLTPFFSGISLDVTPQIDDDGYVTIHIHPIVSNVVKDEQKFQVNGLQQDLPLAQSTVRESDSVVRAKNGQVIVIGGLMENKRYDNEASTPGADRLPGISGLFKNADKKASKFELVILLRPVVVGGTSTWQQRLQETAADLNSMKGNFSYNIVPARHRSTHTHERG